jgi:serine/threonine protein kinase
MDIILNHRYEKIKYTVDNRLVCNNVPYEIGELINLGGNAIVHECSSTRTSEELAIKFQIKTHGTREKRFKQEMEIHERLSHPHLVKFFGSGSIEARYKNQSGREKRKDIYYVIMDKCDQNLQDYIKEKSQTIPYLEYIGQFRGLVSALAELHKVAIHRDIKPSNILIKNGMWKLSDFGLCSYVDPDERNDFTLVEEKIGPANWMSPESNSKLAGYNTVIDKHSDVFQLASVFWMIINKKHPTGVLSEQDWISSDTKLYNVLFSALQHCPTRRPQDGELFLNSLVNAIEIPMAP